MKKVFQFKIKKALVTMEIKASKKLINKFIYPFLTIFSNLNPLREKEGGGDNPDITLKLKESRNFKIVSHKKRKIIWISDRKSVYNKKILCFFTKYGSSLKMNISNRRLKGEVKDNDPYFIHLLTHWFNSYILMIGGMGLHSASVLRNDRLLIFAGESGVGKSTISNLLKPIKGFKIINDDGNFFISIFKKAVMFLPAPSSSQYSHIQFQFPHRIFFVQRDKIKETGIIPISKKEAFKRILALAKSLLDADGRNDLREIRLDVLENLVKQCRCYLLINGEDLKSNPNRFKKLLFSII